MVTPAQHQAFKDLHRQYFDGMAGITLTWERLNEGVDRFGEGESYGYESVPIKAIVGFNHFRTWPVNRGNEGGVQDYQHLYVMINMDYLSENGYVSDWGNFNFDPTLDRFKHAGLTYTPIGDTDIAQIYSEAGYYMVILQRLPQ
jgi:hypothetical protein